MGLEIRHRLALALRLIDTANGRTITERDVRVWKDGRRVHPMFKEDRHLIFVGDWQGEYELELKVRGYEPVIYHLDERVRQRDLHLIPNDEYRRWTPTFCLEGRLEGLDTLDAVKLQETKCFIQDVNLRRKHLTIFNPNCMELDRVWYALLNPEEGNYEVFEMLERISNETFRVDQIPEQHEKKHFPLAPLVFGRVHPDGSYRLCVRDEEREARWIIRYQQNGETYFRSVDFRAEEPIVLT